MTGKIKNNTTQLNRQKIKIAKQGIKPLKAKDIYRHCTEVIKANAKITKEKPYYEIISQTRAVKAISFGLGMGNPGYNIYVAGVPGTGKTSVIRTFLEKTAKKRTTPGDIIFVYNFKTPESPKSIGMNVGEAKTFKKQMEQLIEKVTEDFAEAFQAEDYENTVNSTVNSGNEKKTKLFSKLEKLSKQKSFGVKSTRMGIVTIPIVKGKPLSEKEYSELSDKQKVAIEKERASIEPEVLDFARKVRAIEAETKASLEKLQYDLGNYVLENAILPIKKEYKLNKDITDYLQEVKKHILENLNDFLPEDDAEGQDDSDGTSLGSHHLKKGDPYLPYRVNVFVDNTSTQGAPIIIENNPTFYNLFGKIEKNIEYGVYTTDFKMIKAGTLAKANGGYLVLQAIDLLRNPHVWETFKRVVKNQKLFIEDLGEQYSILPTSGLRPTPIELDIKIILIGSDWVYHMLYQFDEEFNKIFKIKADFDSQMERNKNHIQDYVNFIYTRTKLEDLLPFDKPGIATIVEFGSRIVEEQNKLSTRFSIIKDITIEANYIAKKRRSKKITREDVEKAIDERYLRSSLVEDHIHEMIENGDIMISTKSKRVGEINGLAVYSLGDISFGIPSRITCRTYRGKPGIVNIERDAMLSGKLHNKGVSILTSWINATFGRIHAPVISATICFEQNYSGVDGDSATLAELCLILATIAGLPIKQGISVTGSINQFGEVQVVGGINEKIEGFFRLCQKKGFNTDQGCIIPSQNVKNLMLSKSLRKAVQEQKFKIWPVRSVENAFEILTGYKAGSWSESKEEFTKNSAFEFIDNELHKHLEDNINNKDTSRKEKKSKATKKK